MRRNSGTPGQADKNSDIIIIRGKKFYPVGIFDSLTREGSYVGHALTFRTSDGQRVAEGFRRFDSAGEARRGLDGTISHSVKIIKRGPKVGRTNQVLEDWVEALYPATASHGQLFRIMWTDGPILHEFISDSLQDVDDLEEFSNRPDRKS